MGLDGVNRWFMELILHKGYQPTPEQAEKYSVPPLEFLQQHHDDMGCLLTRENKIKYWRWRVAQAKDGEPQDLRFAMSILTKYIRGIYQ